MSATTASRVDRFRGLHVAGRPLVLPTVWDAPSAVAAARAGASALATTSAAVSWTRGSPDGSLSRREAVAALRYIIDAVDVSVSADLEAGYGASPSSVSATVRLVVDLGVVGVNIEDSDDTAGSLRPVEEQAERLHAAYTAATEAGSRLFLNARTDVYLTGRTGQEAVEEAVERATAYATAGADGLFLPGIADLPSIEAVTSCCPIPVSVMAGPGGPTIEQLAAVGVARVTVGPAMALAAYELVARATTQLLGAGTYHDLSAGFSFSDFDSGFRPSANRTDTPAQTAAH